jgi:hypothetical protein
VFDRESETPAWTLQHFRRSFVTVAVGAAH